MKFNIHLILRRVLGPGALAIYLLTYQMPSLAGAAPLCRQIFSGTRIFNTSDLHNLGKWISKNQSGVDIASTHLSAAEPLVIQVRTDLEQAIIAKANDPYFGKRAPQMRQLIAEMNERLARKTITYEYLYLLSFRMGVFTNTRVPEPLTEIFHRDIDFPEVFEVKNYKTHEAFVKLLSRVQGKKAFPESRVSDWTGIYIELKKFPERIYLPFSGELNYRDINILNARGIAPIGIVFKESKVDGTTYSELSFPRHDKGHGSALDFEYGWGSAEIPSKFLVSIQYPTLVRVENHRLVNQVEADILHFLHFQVFHELSAKGWLFKNSEGQFVNVPSRENLRNSIHFGIARIGDQILDESNRGVSANIRIEFRNLMKKYDGFEFQPILKHSMHLYEQILQSELSKTDISELP